MRRVPGATRPARRRRRRARVRRRVAGAAAPRCASRILDAARAERSNVIPLRPRWTFRVADAVAAVAAVRGDRPRDLGRVALAARSTASGARAQQRRDARSASSPSSAQARHRTAARNARSSRRERRGDARRLAARRRAGGKTYEAWVIKDSKPVRAGTFPGGGDTIVIPLDRARAAGSIVAVTVEPKPGGDAPTRPGRDASHRLPQPTSERGRTTMASRAVPETRTSASGAGSASFVSSRSCWFSSCSRRRPSRSG